MGYTPYKMAADNNDPMTKNYGVVAPGKMRSFGTKDSDMPDGISQKSGILYKGGVGGSPAKGFFKNMFNKVKKGVQKVGGAVGGALGLQKAGAGGGKIKAMDDRISALEEGAGAGADGNAVDATSAVPGAGGDPLLGDLGPMSGCATGGEINKTEDVEKPGSGGFGAGAAQNAVSMLSDIRLKEKIEKAGKSPSGIPIYMFNYVGENKRYEGVQSEKTCRLRLG